MGREIEPFLKFYSQELMRGISVLFQNCPSLLGPAFVRLFVLEHPFEPSLGSPFWKLAETTTRRCTVLLVVAPLRHDGKS
ncbi:hypothetical protein NEUTE1DRAFT_103803 [Neurospora tetrasperma FGSC 2508]|uniref:Uncharacterized protein n=1 Tax=Neurospora tetrasperma (strain FGSC 2508 / ATCC MYA-4615 / P0657) TaxID=510951 RepID=F8MX83_NEUT8|nr:uncharacterized protein NEUTE1DRAFT_103803 [Neurospora tetrasperma FGSC 2508]EGO54354.1 hypothetical protein NEUTE1DRAFT_103803 [Neurospora tetrasperma FGSC 2508]